MEYVIFSVMVGIAFGILGTLSVYSFIIHKDLKKSINDSKDQKNVPFKL